eukprot:CAMPEP_0114379700 /NCGR_PEP_ID=MMETSP0102-20121206/2406_1 /TAXON_ID=38822 ORGANISM="Pteridomonas danica, Strain PT" /NCGR_SAMPLE_ID=MMETSP0102 /ASSEMBLY_ACC=CAM_ASM_000212 /LENGTH=93 /DNA_ID=CAMNT_0001534833 /DNA_START=1292 /DNA_END=1570 /DNA_ORIENTATION=-
MNNSNNKKPTFLRKKSVEQNEKSSFKKSVVGGSGRSLGGGIIFSLRGPHELKDEDKQELAILSSGTLLQGREVVLACSLPRMLLQPWLEEINN